MRATGWICALAVSSIAAGAEAQNAAGSACSARSECRGELHCLNNVCVDEPTFRASQPRVEQADKKETIGYIGASLGTSLPALLSNGWGEAFQVGFRLGTIIDDTFQLQLETSPLTTGYLNMAPSAFSSFDVVASVGVLAHLNDFTSWIFRVGGGAGGVFGYPAFNQTGTTPSSIYP